MSTPAQGQGGRQRQDINRLGSALAQIARRAPHHPSTPYPTGMPAPAAPDGAGPCRPVTPYSPWTRRKRPLYNF